MICTQCTTWTGEIATCALQGAAKRLAEAEDLLDKALDNALDMQLEGPGCSDDDSSDSEGMPALSLWSSSSIRFMFYENICEHSSQLGYGASCTAGGHGDVIGHGDAREHCSTGERQDSSMCALNR